MNSLVMFDRETESLWSQFLGEAVEGPLSGVRLEFVSSQLTTWDEWKAQHPNTSALDTGLSGPAPDSYLRYYTDARSGRLGQTNYDDRLGAKELVLGINGEDSARAYALKHLDAARVINDEFEGRPIVVAFNVPATSVAAFDRTVDNVALVFEDVDDTSMADGRTGSIWRKDTGVALEGPLKGKHMKRVRSLTSFWFAWSDFKPQTEIYVP